MLRAGADLLGSFGGLFFVVGDFRIRGNLLGFFSCLGCLAKCVSLLRGPAGMLAGAGSNVRRSLGIDFDGFTWPERFLVVSTPFDFHTVIPDLVAVSYVCDPERWHFLLQIPGLCRVMFPIAPHESDELALSQE